MVQHVYCVVSGGIPVFYRSSAKETTLSFSELAPLNGIQVFGKVHAIAFESTAGNNFTVYWKNFTEKLSLILITKHAILSNGDSILNCIFDAMVLTVGIDELTTIKQVDRLKKEIRPCYLLVDEILKSVGECHENLNNFQLLSMTEVIPSMYSNILQEKLEEWSASISSLFCCLTKKNKILVATPAWWDLTPIEKSLLSLLVEVNSNCTTIDIPVFLPVKSPKIAFRLISCCLMDDIWVSALCGPTPSIMEFEQSAVYCWNHATEYLTEISSTIPQIIPENLNIQNGITGLLLINYNVGKYVLLGSVVNNKQHFDMLRIFYYQNVKELLEENDKNDNHKARETFWYSENYKLYGLISDPHILCLMTSSVVPTPSARLISKDMLSSIINNKLFVW